MAHSYGSQHIDKFRCDCAKCVPMSAAERKERQGEPAQDPRTWHHPVARGRRPLVVGRTFNGEKLSAFVQRHIAENTIEEHEEAGTEIDPEQDWYRIFAFEKTAPPGHDPDDPDVDEDGFIDDPVLRVTRDSAPDVAGHVVRRREGRREAVRPDDAPRRVLQERRLVHGLAGAAAPLAQIWARRLREACRGAPYVMTKDAVSYL